MMIRFLETSAELCAYDAALRATPQGSLWQSLEWKKYQESLGKEVKIYASYSQDSTIHASALVVIDRTLGGLSTWEIPRGPCGESQELFARILTDAKREKCLALYFSGTTAEANDSSIRPSSRHVHPEATRVIDLTKTEEEILSEMHPKGRYNITLAKKHDIKVVEGTNKDIGVFYELLKGTGGRDGFSISQQSHYAHFLSDLEGSYLLLATHEGRPIAGLLGVIWPPLPRLSAATNHLPSPTGRGVGGEGLTGVYYYGASSYEHRNLMAPYLLQWEAMRRAKAHGCVRYDLLGISPENAGADDPWQGISDFKRKFGGIVISYPPEHMVVMRPVAKWALEMKRRILG